MGKFNQAQKVDEIFFKTFKDSKNFIEIFETGIEGILKLIPENEAIPSKNQEITILIQKKTAIDKLISEMQDDYKKFNEAYNENIDKYVEEGKKKTVVFSQIAQIAFGNFTPITNKTTNDVNIFIPYFFEPLSIFSCFASLYFFLSSFPPGSCFLFII